MFFRFRDPESADHKSGPKNTSGANLINMLRSGLEKMGGDPVENLTNLIGKDFNKMHVEPCRDFDLVKKMLVAVSHSDKSKRKD